ncbi:ATP synthase subunit ATP5MPL, mitochondrial [Lemmus lemmus]
MLQSITKSYYTQAYQEIWVGRGLITTLILYKIRSTDKKKSKALKGTSPACTHHGIILSPFKMNHGG